MLQTRRHCQPCWRRTGRVHYEAASNQGSASSDLRDMPSPDAALSPEYAYMLGLVDRLSSPLLEPFVDGAPAPVVRSAWKAAKSAAAVGLGGSCDVSATARAPPHKR